MDTPIKKQKAIPQAPNAHKHVALGGVVFELIPVLRGNNHKFEGYLLRELAE